MGRRERVHSGMAQPAVRLSFRCQWGASCGISAAIQYQMSPWLTWIVTVHRLPLLAVAGAGGVIDASCAPLAGRLTLRSMVRRVSVGSYALS